jgi:RimJ/RimL family protein N-acetyltransferase
LQPEDFEALYAVGSDPLIWEQHPQPQRWQRENFMQYFEHGLASKGALLARTVDTQAVVGCSRFHDYEKSKSQVVIGFTFIGRAYWGGTFNRELKSLMLNHAFHHVENVIFYVGEQNWRSRKAMEKIGGRLVDHLTTRNSVGALQKTVVYRIRKADWSNLPVSVN